MDGTGARASGARDGGEDSGLALGVLTYAGATMIHEPVGHGGVCLATGGRVTLLDPLGMRCSVVRPAMVAAGPLANFAGGALAWLLLRGGRISRGNARWFLWLTMAFDLLVAAGYMVVSGAAGFGDWAALAAPLPLPAWAWRTGLVVLGVALYDLFLHLLAVEYRRLTGPSGAEPRRLRRLVLLPTGAAAAMATAAAALSSLPKPTALALALGTTAVVGATLLTLPGFAMAGDQAPAPPPARPAPSLPLAIAALLVALAYVALLGPGVKLSGG